jgi:hypothetical protein
MKNPIALFKEVFPDAPLLIGDVIASDGGLSTVELQGGAIVQVRGDANPGQRVFVRDGLIESTAPMLPVVEIEI